MIIFLCFVTELLSEHNSMRIDHLYRSPLTWPLTASLILYIPTCLRDIGYLLVYILMRWRMNSLLTLISILS